MQSKEIIGMMAIFESFDNWHHKSYCSLDLHWWGSTLRKYVIGEECWRPNFLCDGMIGKYTVCPVNIVVNKMPRTKLSISDAYRSDILTTCEWCLSEINNFQILAFPQFIKANGNILCSQFSKSLVCWVYVLLCWLGRSVDLVWQGIERTFNLWSTAKK
jgi:hypothetical protein